MAELDTSALTPEEARAMLSAPEPDTLGAGAGGRAIDTLLPLSRAAVGKGRVERLIEENSRPDVPLQINPPEGDLSNVSPWIRFQTARRQTLDDQQKYLESKFGQGKVRKAKDSDDFIVEVPDRTTGKPRDIMLNEDMITLGDLASLAGHAPEVATSMLSMVGAGKLGLVGKTPSFLRTVGLILSGAAGLKAGEAAQQIETRLEQGQAPEVVSTIAEKAKEIPIQAGLDAATAGLFKTIGLGYRITKGGPGMFKTDVQREGLEATGRLSGKYGTGLSYSAAESSGMPLLSFLEAYAAAKPQATAIVNKFKDAQLYETKALGEALTSKTGTDEQIGDELLAFLDLNRNMKANAVQTLRESMTREQSDALTKLLGKVSPVTAFKPSEAGASLRKGFQSAYQDVKSKVQTAYGDAYATPGTTLPDVPTKPIADQIDRLSEQFPTAEGAQWMKGLKQEMSEKESYRDLVQRRSDLWNKIETAPADRSTKDYIHSQLSKSITETLDDASKNILNPEFRSKILKANDLYKKSELPFYQKGLRDVLMTAGEPGSPENITLLKRFGESTDLYRRLVEVAGKKSEPVKAVQQSIVDGLLLKSATSPIDPKFIDASQFIKNLKAFTSSPETREMATDIFGKNADALLNEAKVLSGIQGSIPKDEAMALLSGGSKAASKSRLQSVLGAQQQLDESYISRLLKGDTDLGSINPEEFVNRVFNRATESELRTLRSEISQNAPALYPKLQDKLVEQILGKAGTYETWNRSNIEKVLNDPKLGPKYREFLQDKFDDLTDFSKALGPRQSAAEQAEGTGMLVKGSSIGALARIFKYQPGKGKSKIGEILEEIPPWVGWKLTGRFITSKAFREWAAKDFPAESANLIPAAILSEPFLEEIATSSSSPEVVRNLALSLRNYTRRVSTPATPQPEENRNKLSPEEARQLLRQP